MAVAEVELLDAVMYLLLSDNGQSLAVGGVEPAVHERRVVVVEPAERDRGCWGTARDRDTRGQI